MDHARRAPGASLVLFICRYSELEAKHEQLPFHELSLISAKVVNIDHLSPPSSCRIAKTVSGKTDRGIFVPASMLTPLFPVNRSNDGTARTASVQFAVVQLQRGFAFIGAPLPIVTRTTATPQLP